MNEVPKLDIDQFTSEGMPTIPLRITSSSANTNRVFGLCIVAIVMLLAIDHGIIDSLLSTYIKPQLGFFIGLTVFAFVVAIVRRWYSLTIVSIACGAIFTGLMWVPLFGGAILGLLIGVAFLLVYGIGRMWFDSHDIWPFVASGVATAYALLSIVIPKLNLPDIIVLPIMLAGVATLFVLGLRRQKAI